MIHYNHRPCIHNLYLPCHILFFLLFLLVFLSSLAQPLKKQADYFFKNYACERALPLYISLLNENPADPELNLKIGQCYLASRSMKEKSIPFFKKNLSNQLNFSLQTIKNEAETYKFLGDACLLSFDFNCALASYTFFYDQSCPVYSSFPDSHNSLCEEIRNRIQLCRVGKEWKESFKGLLDSARPNLYFEQKIYQENKAECSNTDAKGTDTPQVQYEATIGTSENGQLILLYKEENGRAELSTVRLLENEWMPKERLTQALNSPGWETGEYVSEDGKEMYFTSDRPGGLGGKDIYKCKKMNNWEWSRAVNLGPPVNTACDEEAPFIHPDGKSLFFSSGSKEKKEIFVSRMTAENKWSAPISAGFPITQDKLTSEIKTAATSTAIPSLLTLHDAAERPALRKEDTCVSFLTGFHHHERETLWVFKGIIADLNGKITAKTKITVTDTETGELFAQYIADSGNFSFFLPHRKDVMVTFESENYFFHTERFVITDLHNSHERREVRLLPVNSGIEIKLNGIAFEPEKSGLLWHSYTTLNLLADFIKKNPKVKAELSYCAAPDKNSIKFSKDLASARAASITSYLSQTGVCGEQLIVKGYGRVKKGKEPGCTLKILASGYPNHPMDD